MDKFEEKIEKDVNKIDKHKKLKIFFVGIILFIALICLVLYAFVAFFPIIFVAILSGQR